MSQSAIPIFAFHRVGPRSGCRFTVPLEVFDAYLTVLEEGGYTTLTCTDLVDVVAGRSTPPPHACLLTFDDGTADIWVYAAPLLRRRGMRATVFVILNRLQHAGPPRPSLEDVWSGDCSQDSLYQLPDLPSINRRALDRAYAPATDHLSWEETRRLASEGTCDIQSHGPDHMVHYISDRLRGFLGPHSHWMAIAAAADDPRPGTPVYDIGSSLVAPAYRDPQPLRDRLADIVVRSGGPAFFAAPDWPVTLRGVFESANDGRGAFEAEPEWGRRVRQTLESCRQTLTRQLGTPVQCLAWPFGMTSPRSQALALESGFVLAFSTQCGGYIPDMPAASVGRVSLKEHAVEAFRRALQRQANAATVRGELARAVYDRPLDVTI